jgi:hypothetical protein
MSSSAGLSAAKRRRIGSTTTNNIVNNPTNVQNEQSVKTQISPMKILENHELRLRSIEKINLPNNNDELLLNEINNLKEENSRLKDNLYNLQLLTVETNSLVMKLLNTNYLVHNEELDESNELNNDKLQESNELNNDKLQESNELNNDKLQESKETNITLNIDNNVDN